MFTAISYIVILSPLTLLCTEITHKGHLIIPKTKHDCMYDDFFPTVKICKVCSVNSFSFIAIGSVMLYVYHKHISSTNDDRESVTLNCDMADAPLNHHHHHHHIRLIKS